MYNIEQFGKREAYIWRQANADIGLVFGQLNIQLVNKETGQIRIAPRPNGAIDDYDFNGWATDVAKFAKPYGNPGPFYIYPKGENTAYIDL